MQQLLSKDVLYQPMKDIGAKYPGWLAAHRCSPTPLPGISQHVLTHDRPSPYPCIAP